MTVSFPDAGSALPTLQGTLRDCTGSRAPIEGVKAGDLVIVDAADLPKRMADALIAANPAAVINLSRYATGSVPNYGPHLMLDAGIALFEASGERLQKGIRSGKSARIADNGELIVGKKTVAQCEPVRREDINAAFDGAQQRLTANTETYFGNAIQFVHAELPLLVDGIGAPELGDIMAGRKVLIVAPSPDTRERIANIKSFMREFTPVIVGVGAAADTLTELEYLPDVIVTDPTHVAAETLRSGACVILPAETDGFAPGLERIQDLGVGAMTFPATTDSELDLAILLAVFHDAETIITVGAPLEFDDIFAQSQVPDPTALVARMKAGSRLVDSRVIEHLYRSERGGAKIAWAWAILGLLVTAATIVVIFGLGGQDAFGQNLQAVWQTFIDMVRRLVSAADGLVARG